jgi:hypothetical protein
MMRQDRELRELDEEGNEEEENVRRKRNEPRKDDVVLEESFNVLVDLIDLTGSEEMPQPKGWWQ